MAKKLTNMETGTITFEVGEETRVFDPAQCSDQMRLQAEFHGFSQKIGDSYAGASKATEDSEMTQEEYILAQIDTAIAQLYAGDWSIRTGAGAGPRITDLVRALCELYPDQAEADVAETVSNMDADQKKQTRAHPAVATILDRLRAERAAAKAAASAAKEVDTELPDLF
jgi:hypothetical protein